MFSLIKKHFTCEEINRFEGLDFETFISLETDVIKEAIPELIPRLNFTTQFKNYLKSIDLQQINQSDITSNMIIIENAGNDNLKNVPPPSDVLPTNELTLFHETQMDFNDIQICSEPAANEKMSPTIRSINSPQDIVDIPSIELKIIIKRYTREPLDNSDRVLIGKEIIRYLLLADPERVIAREEFKEISANIVKLFPNETAGCYFTESQGTVQAQGKLYSAYSKLKAKLRDVGLISKRQKLKSVKKVDVQEKLDDTDQSDNALKFVCEETGDFERIKENWIQSHKQRVFELLSKLKTLDYINLFPAFDLANGYELLCIDASLTHADLTSKLLPISKKILIFASRLRNRSLDASILLNDFNALKSKSTDETVLAVQQQLFALKLLPHLLKGSYKRKSKAEVVVSFYTSYETIAEAEEKDKKAGSALPHLNLIGESTVPVAQIVIAGKKFLIEDPITGFDVLFKTFLALSLKYPDECKHLWLFIQKSVYGVHKSTDIKLANVSTFIQDIANISDD